MAALQTPPSQSGLGTLISKPASGVQTGIDNFSAGLRQKSVPELLGMLNNPVDKTPKIIVLDTIDKLNKAEKLREQQNAMQAQMQARAQPITEAQRILGELNTYANGGVVAFSKGAEEDGVQSAQTFPVIDQREVDRILKKGPAARTPGENAYLEAAGIKLERRPAGAPFSLSDTLTNLFKGALTNPSDVEAAKKHAQAQQALEAQRLRPIMESLEPSRQPLPQTPLPPEFVDTAPPPKTDTRAAPGGAAPEAASRTGAPESKQKTVSPPPVPLPPGLPSLADYQPFIDAERARLAAAGAPSAEVLKERGALTALQAAQEAARQKEAERRETGLAALRKQAEETGRVGPDQARRALIMGMGGARTLAEGFGKAEAQLANIEEKAAEQRRQAQRFLIEREDVAARLAQTDREMSAAIQQLRLAEATGDDKLKRETQAQVNALLLQQATLKKELYSLNLETAKAQSEMEYRRRTATAAETQAAKERAPTAFEQYKGDPTGYAAFIKATTEPKTEGAVSKALVTEMIKNPLKLQLLKESDPGLYQAIQQEIAKISGAPGADASVPPAGAVREKGK